MTHRVTAADTQFALVDEGCGVPLVLLHGFPLDHRMWSAQIEALRGRCRVLAPDLRGFGQTPLGEVDLSDGYGMERHADDLAALLDAHGVTEPIVLCGFSMGGYIAWQFVKKYAERLRGLVLCDTRAAADAQAARAARLDMAEHMAEWGTAHVAEIMMPKLVAAATLQDRPELVEEIRRMIVETSPEAIAAAQRGMAARPDMTGLLGSIRVPTLVIVGAEDSISTREEMTGIAEAIEGARLAVIPAAGHMAPMESPHAVNAAMIEFLQATKKSKNTNRH